MNSENQEIFVTFKLYLVHLTSLVNRAYRAYITFNLDMLIYIDKELAILLPEYDIAHVKELSF